MKRHIKLIFVSITLIFSTFVSCHAKCSDSELANIILKAQADDFSSLLPLTNKKMKRLLKTDEASLVCLGLYLHKNNLLNEAKALFKFAVENCGKPFSTLAREKLFYISDYSEKVEFLDEKINELSTLHKKDKKSSGKEEPIKKEIEELQNMKEEYLFLAGDFEAFKEDVPTLFANRAMKTEVFLAYELLCDREEILDEEFRSVMKMRQLVLEKKYGEAYKESSKLLENAPASLIKTRYVFYDFMRSLFLGSKNYKENANLIKSFFNENKKYVDKGNIKAIEYLTNLYLARLYEKAGDVYKTQSLKYYDMAIKTSPTPYDFDDSNWFKLNLKLKADFYDFLKDFSSSLPQWDNHVWYEDLVSRAIKDCVSKKRFDALKQFYEIVKKTKLEEQKAKLKYILARQGLIEKNNIKEIYKEIYEGEHNLIYYTLLSAYHLKQPIREVLYKKKINRQKKELYTSEEAMKILNTYLKYGLHRYVYKEAMRIYPAITVREATQLSKELQLKEYFPDSINLVQFALNSEDSSFSDEALRCVYPRPFYKEVSKWAKEYNVSEYLMYALIRSESFFRSHVVSHAGAVGLAQLMPRTALEIARSLKIKKYDVLNPEDNIHFGTYYLSNMIKHFNGKIMPGMCAYNAGPNAVSRWLKNNTIEKEDIFVEGIPYDETRNYGKKLLSTACMYAMLYYNKTPNQVIEEIYKEIGN